MRANWNLVLPKKMEKQAPKKWVCYCLSLAAYVFSLVRANWDLELAKMSASKSWGLYLWTPLLLSCQHYMCEYVCIHIHIYIYCMYICIYILHVWMHRYVWEMTSDNCWFVGRLLQRLTFGQLLLALSRQAIHLKRTGNRIRLRWTMFIL